MTELTCSLFIYNGLKGTSQFEALVSKCQADYELVNYFRLYHSYFAGKSYVLILLTLIIVPISFLNIKLCADEFVSQGIMRIQKKFGISPLIAAFTLIPLANGAPDLIVTYITAKGGGGDSDVAVGTLASSFVFAATIVVAAVIFCGKQTILRVPVVTVIKEISFFIVIYALIIGMGYYGSTKPYFALFNVAIFCLYIGTSIFLAMRAPQEEDKLLEESQQELSQIAYAKLRSAVKDYLYDVAEPVTSAVCFPFKCIYLISVPSISSPFFTTPIQYAVVTVGALLFAFEMDIPGGKLYLSLGAASVALVLFGLMQIPAIREHKVFVFDVLTLLVAISWIKFFSTTLLDSIKYISFVIGVGKTFISMIIISLGNSTPDLFANGSIAAEGEGVMALLGTLSSQFTNFAIGTAIMITFNKSGEFDLFGRFTPSSNAERRLMRIIFTFAIGVMACILFHGTASRGFSKSYAYIGICLYLCFLISTGFYSFS